LLENDECVAKLSETPAGWGENFSLQATTVARQTTTVTQSIAGSYAVISAASGMTNTASGVGDCLTSPSSAGGHSIMTPGAVDIAAVAGIASFTQPNQLPAKSVTIGLGSFHISFANCRL